MLKRKRTIIISCIALLAVVATAQAQQDKGRRGGPDAVGGLFPGCPLNLNLTQDQTARLQEQRNLFFKDTTGLRSDVFKKEQELDSLMLEQSPDQEKARKLQNEISGLRGQLAQKALDAQLSARNILTPEQIRQLPPGCTLGIGAGMKGCGMGGMGQGCGLGGMGQGCGLGSGGGRRQR